MRNQSEINTYLQAIIDKQSFAENKIDIINIHKD